MSRLPSCGADLAVPFELNEMISLGKKLLRFNKYFCLQSSFFERGKLTQATDLKDEKYLPLLASTFRESLVLFSWSSSEMIVCRGRTLWVLGSTMSQFSLLSSPTACILFEANVVSC